MNQADADLEHFLTAISEHWMAVSKRNTKKANAYSEASQKIVSRWVDKGVAISILQTLLSSNSLEVRFSAASHLHTLGRTDLSVPALRSVRDSGANSPALFARVILMRDGYA